MNMAVFISSSILFLAVWLGFKILNGEFYIRPGKIIGVNYLSRWHIIPRNNYFNIYLHRITGSDDEGVMHDHPFNSFSILLKGKMLEHRRLELNNSGQVIQNSFYGKPVKHYAKRFTYREANFAHRLEMVKGPVWTLFITGPRRFFPGTNTQEWYFYCPHQSLPVPWYKMTNEKGEMIGGCGEQ